MARQRTVVGVIAAARATADQHVDLPASVECFDRLREGRRVQECSENGASDYDDDLAAKFHERSLVRTTVDTLSRGVLAFHDGKQAVLSQVVDQGWIHIVLDFSAAGAGDLRDHVHGGFEIWLQGARRL